MPYPKEKKKLYDREYNKMNTKRVPLDVQKTYYNEVLKPAADQAGMKVNTFIKEALKEKIEGPANTGPSGICLDIPQEELDVYAQAADERGMTLEEMIIEALKVFIKEY